MLTCPDEPKVRVSRSGACFVFPHLFETSISAVEGQPCLTGFRILWSCPQSDQSDADGSSATTLSFRYFRALLPPLDKLRRRPWYKCLLESLEQSQNRYITTSIVPHQSRVYNLPRYESNVSLFRVSHLVEAICMCRHYKSKPSYPLHRCILRV